MHSIGAYWQTEVSLFAHALRIHDADLISKIFGFSPKRHVNSPCHHVTPQNDAASELRKRQVHVVTLDKSRQGLRRRRQRKATSE